MKIKIFNKYKKKILRKLNIKKNTTVSDTKRNKVIELIAILISL